MLSGIDAPSEDGRAVYPESLFQELKHNIGNYYIHLASPVGRRKDEQRYLKDILSEDENRTEITRYLLGKYPTDLFIVVYNNIDRVQHQTLTHSILGEIRSGTFKSPEARLLVEVYKETDEKVGQILSQFDEDTLCIIMSDHGAGPIQKVFYLNRWLERNGWLAYRSRGMESFYRSIQKARTLSKRVFPRWGKNFIKSKIPGLRDRVESYLSFSDIDWSQTKAYGFGTYGNIYMNLRGREPKGVVDPGTEYEELRDEIREKLEELRDPDTNEILIEKVLKREDVYHGPHVKKAPDLLIKWKDYSYYTSVGLEADAGGLFGPCQNIDSSEYQHLGTHRLEGIFMAKGSGIGRGSRIVGAEIADIAPTLLYYFNQPIPKDMDGKVLKDIFTPDFWTQNSLRTSETSLLEENVSEPHVPYSRSEAAEVYQRLKGLGYIE